MAMQTRSRALREQQRALEEDEEDGDIISVMMHYVTSEYELLRFVLESLPYRDLETAGTVCKAWSKAAAVEKNFRNQPQWSMWTDDDDVYDMEEYPRKMFLDDVDCAPELCLAFMTNKICRSKINCQASSSRCPFGRSEACKSTHIVANYLRAELSPSALCIIAECSGIIGTNKLEATQEVLARRFGYSTFMIPKIPDVGVTTFTFDELNELEDNIEIPQISAPIRGIILFCRDGYKSLASTVMRKLNQTGGAIPLGGGVFKSLKMCTVERRGHKMTDVVIFCMVFNGKNVRADSVILSHRVRDVTAVETAVKKLQNNVPRDVTCSIGFMFACVSRACYWYDRENVESDTFRQIFPSVPLLGYFGNGEIGDNSVPVADPEEENPYFRRLIHSFSTVFLMLHFGKFSA